MSAISTAEMDDMSGIPGQKSISELVDLGLCTGYGARVFTASDRFAMAMNADGHLTPVQKEGSAESEVSELLHLCPMSGAGTDETEFAARLHWPSAKQIQRRPVPMARGSFGRSTA